MIRALALALALLVPACAPEAGSDLPTRADADMTELPPMKVFRSTRALAPVRSNQNIAADFLSLFFELESGRALPVFTRFEGPITLRVTGRPAPSLNADLTNLLSRLDREAGIKITRIDEGEASITIHSVNRADIKRALPEAACFVVPNVTTLNEFRRNRRKAATNWSLLRERHRLGIFVPNDVAPQELRDCLHEEVAQALGPVNDLYRLPDSVFNDDNVHTVLTGFDMLILKATYAPELYSGMSKSQVASHLPRILSRMNPRGDAERPEILSPTPRSWIDDVQVALGPGAGIDARRTAAASAARTAEELGWHDHRRAFSHYMLGRMIQTYDPPLAQNHYSSALSYLERLPGTELHRAFITTQTAAYAIARGDGTDALRQIGPYLDVAAQAENAALLATLMLLQAEALDLTDRPEIAKAVRLDSLGWARYGFGSDDAVRAKMAEIASLNPRSRRG